MAVIIYLPAYLQPFAGGRSEVDLPTGSVTTVGEALHALRARYPGVYERIVTECGEVREHVNVFVGSDRIRDGDGLASRIEDGGELVVLPAITGG